MAMVFRQTLRRNDLEVLSDLARSTGFFSEEEVAVVEELVQEALNRGPASGYNFILAEEENNVEGFACYGPVPMTNGSFDLYWIAVQPSRSRKGLGSLLLQQVEEKARTIGCRRLYAETTDREQYTPTREFYLRRGFREVASLEDFYASGEGKIIYCKIL